MEIVKVKVKVNNEGTVNMEVVKAPIEKETGKMYVLARTQGFPRKQIRKAEIGMIWGDDYITSINREIWLLNPSTEEIQQHVSGLKGIIRKIIGNRMDLHRNWLDRL